MRLTQINLAGFKSFVDPTHVPVPGQLVGIVGPNGCGKSNIIDAVRWVLGETSARHLRGETMQDVLFNGSGDRKPVNRASVELIFDNSLGKAAGQWSKYAEISIKRVLERDGESTYYINNLHVRRRDIADIFLGTGLGARAYAIIEQGMISRVIEAKPEELRIFLEEAAGVSRYRERRRETESRLHDTRENLLRVDDIRQELASQLEHLQAQAEVARHYHELQAELATTQSLVWLTKKQEAAQTRNRHAREIERVTIELEAETAKLRDAEKRLEELRTGHYRVGDEVHAAQGALYEANAEVARLEQHIAHIRDKRQRIEHQLSAFTSQLQHAEDQQTAAQTALAEYHTGRSEAEARVAQCEQKFAEETEKLPVAEEAFRAANARREEFLHAVAQNEQALQVEQTKLAHAARVLEALAQRRERLLEEQATLPAPDTAALERAEQEVAALEQALGEHRSALARNEEALPQLEQSLRDRSNAYDAAMQQLTGTEARIHALQQLQEKLARGAGMEDWLAARGLHDAPRLWQAINIEPGWDDALEAVLRERLNGLTVEQFDSAALWLRDTPPGKMTVIGSSAVPDSPTEEMPGGAAPLRRYVVCRNARLEGVLREWLHGVYVVPDVASGMSLRGALRVGDILVTREGHICTRHSVSFHAPDSELHGVLSRQREIETLQQSLAEQRSAVAGIQEEITAAEQRIEQHKAQWSELREAVRQTQQRHHELQMEAVRLTEQAQRFTQRGEQIAAELAEIGQHTDAENVQRAAAEAVAASVAQAAQEARDQLAVATELHTRAEAVVQLQREAVQNARHEHQETQFELRTFELKIADIEATLERTAEAIASLKASIEAERTALAECNDEPAQAQLQQALATRVEREQALARARDAMEGAEAQLKSVEEERLVCEQRLDPLRERINDVRLREQEARLTEEQYARQLTEAGAREDELRAMLERGTRSSALLAEIARLNEEIAALGAVNLAALEELQAAQERKTYLDAQSADLTEAMATLEDAIRRIDRETRERLQQTFDDVNAHFGKMFPALFGGGNAKLVLTGEEILDAGVHVIAQPPGKKNTSIHLLSGGEKALTALALVFSMFQLNPAPFCLLDEVDAPLDDYNTGRFCDLVKQMSDNSQFLFISHNKITMEIAQQLLGITMQEPGVSRVVAVDIDEAMKLTEEAA